MRKMLIRYATGVSTIVVLTGCLWANWPQWRGPESNGTAPKARNLPVTWSDSQNILWRTKMPSWSAATPAVWEDWIFVTSAEEGSPRLRSEIPGDAARDKIFLIGINRKDGSIRWQRQIDSGNRLFRKQNSASPSPITDGRQVWIMTGNGKLTCLSLDGNEVWKRDVGQPDLGQSCGCEQSDFHSNRGLSLLYSTKIEWQLGWATPRIKQGTPPSERRARAGRDAV